VSEPYRPRWAELLIEAVNRPGLILEGYSWFHKYSIGNQIAVLWQCRRRGIEPGPIATFWQWQELGRRVKAGQRALHLRMPVIVREKRNAESPNRPGPLARRMIFVWKANWFVLSQTDGKPYQADRRPDWSKDRALVTLNVEEIPFTLLDGNTQGYTEGRKIAINPIAKLPWKTLFHELGHVLLEHTAQAATADGEPPRGRGGSRGPYLLRLAPVAGCRILPRLHPRLAWEGEPDSGRVCRPSLQGGRQRSQGRKQPPHPGGRFRFLVSVFKSQLIAGSFSYALAIFFAAAIAVRTPDFSRIALTLALELAGSLRMAPR
jgi:hypothetical protein